MWAGEKACWEVDWLSWVFWVRGETRHVPNCGLASMVGWDGMAFDDLGRFEGFQKNDRNSECQEITKHPAWNVGVGIRELIG